MFCTSSNCSPPLQRMQWVKDGSAKFYGYRAGIHRLHAVAFLRLHQCDLMRVQRCIRACSSLCIPALTRQLNHGDLNLIGLYNSDFYPWELLDWLLSNIQDLSPSPKIIMYSTTRQTCLSTLQHIIQLSPFLNNHCLLTTMKHHRQDPQIF